MNGLTGKLFEMMDLDQFPELTKGTKCTETGKTDKISVKPDHVVNMMTGDIPYAYVVADSNMKIITLLPNIIPQAVINHVNVIRMVCKTQTNRILIRCHST